MSSSSRGITCFHSYRFQFLGILNWHDVIGINMLRKKKRNERGMNFQECSRKNRKLHMRKAWDVKDDTFQFPPLNLIPSNSVLISFSWCDFDVYICEKEEKNNDGLFLWYPEAEDTHFTFFSGSVGCVERDLKAKKHSLKFSEYKSKTF